ncbi:MAG: hypothetical protein GF355_07870, partial [Candidatus Eisenbacteria bacterium]|nr:hypothetical protein [Candidatus Eisenbacteria bacterium]
MRACLCTVLLVTMTAAAAEEKPDLKPEFRRNPMPCFLEHVEINWDFSLGDQGFTTVECDEGAEAVWEWGFTTLIPEAPANVWATGLDSLYWNDAGEGLRSPSFTVTEQSYLVNVRHYYDTEPAYDGGNLIVQPFGDLLHPIGGYPDTVSASPSYYANCVDDEEGYTGTSGGWITDCFDLEEYLGMTISLEFDFGADNTARWPGWYLHSVVVGGNPVQMGVCCDLQTGACGVHTEGECAALGGIWDPELTSCEPNPCPASCNLGTVVHDWDFRYGPQGFGETNCDYAGHDVWEYGYTYYVPGDPTYCWGTVLNDYYSENGGRGIYSPVFAVTDSTYMVEVYHYFSTEYGYDGCNVLAGINPPQVIHPTAGYTVSEINPSGGYYAYCVDGEPGWTGSSGGWRLDCFDLSDFIGQSTYLEFDFGSDSSFQLEGWYIQSVKVGAPGPPLFEPELEVGLWKNAEPWHDWLGPANPGDGVLQVPLELHIPNFDEVITHVDFYWDNDGWVYLGTDNDGAEELYDTYGPAQPFADGWSLTAELPLPIVDTTLQFKAVTHTTLRNRYDYTQDYEYDPAPAHWSNGNLDDWETFDEDTMGVNADPNGTDVDYIVVYLRHMDGIYDKGVPGINQQSNSSTHCVPAATAQCLKYFEIVDGDVEITGGLGDHALVDSLGAYMGTNLGSEPGTYYAGWVAGLGDWITGHGDGYTLRAHKHYDPYGWTWIEEEDWLRIRNELQRSHDVLLGVYWFDGADYSGGHAQTLNGIANEPLGNGRYVLEFKDPWIGDTSWGELDPATGHLYNVTGAGGGGEAHIASTVIVAPEELYPGYMASQEPVYSGPNPWPGVVPIPFPSPGDYFVDLVVVNMAGNAHRTTYAVSYA